MYHVDVILPLPLPQLYTYRVDEFVETGCRVVVQFGKRKFYSGLVSRCYESPLVEGIKDVISVLDTSPIVLPHQLQLWQWMSEYYMCSPGEILKAALPAAFKLESETLVRLADEAFWSEKLTAGETKIFDLLSDGNTYRIAEISKHTGLASPIQPLRLLMDKGLVVLDEQLEKNFTPRSETLVRLAVSADDELHLLLDGLKRAPMQQKVLQHFLSSADGNFLDFAMPSKKLLAETGATSAVLKALVEKKILLTEQREVHRDVLAESKLLKSNVLSDAQQKACDEVLDSFRQKDVTLLHGVTSSGKTELYISLIDKYLEQGKQVLYLLPEIALTTQITERLKAVFGEKLGVYHSKFSDRERAELWNEMLKSDTVQVILGVRSSVFLPFRNLGLVIVDEEHDASYKQQDPAPRYHGRNVGIVLASLHGAKTLLGTATPSLETYYNALHEKYGLVRLQQRFSNIPMPQIEVVNTKELRRTKAMPSKLFSPPLLQQMAECFRRGEQVILFRNRRGFAPYLECKSCSWSPRCANCDVSLTFHKQQNQLSCHYCGAVYRVEQNCPACQLIDGLEVVGYGTERVEEELSEHFPEVRLARLDLDTTRSRSNFEKIIHDFSERKTDVLIGTQMVSKGLDFGGVGLVGILQSDSLFNQPDFRSHERAFQMLEQVSGRAGRKGKQGNVVLQTTNPDNAVLKAVCQHDYEQFYHREIKERETFYYPPFCRLFHIVMRAKDDHHLEKGAQLLAEILRQGLKNRVFGPVRPVVSRIQTLYIRQLLLKVELSASPSRLRAFLRQAFTHFQAQAQAKGILLHVDVDPV